MLAGAFNTAGEAGSGFRAIMDGLVWIFGVTAKMTAGAAYGVQVLGTQIGVGLATTIMATQAALSGQFSKAKEIVSSGLDEIKSETDKHYQEMVARQATIDTAMQKSGEDRDAKEISRLKAHTETSRALLNEAEGKKQEDLMAKEEEKRGFLEQQFYADMATKTAQDQMMFDSEFMRRLTNIDLEIASEEDRLRKLDLIKKREQMIKDKNMEIEKSQLTAMQKFKEFMGSQDVQNASAVFGQISQLQQSKNKEMVIIGKAAAIAQITISTATGVARAFELGPILGPILAPLVIAAGAMQAGKVAGVALAEGGIVRATPGGIQATIGEGGRDEAVIPLDSDGAMSRLGGGVTVHFHGPVMGDESQAREFAKVLDKQLLELRRGNESVAFDSGVT
jgi:hypothetical protein